MFDPLSHVSVDEEDAAVEAAVRARRLDGGEADAASVYAELRTLAARPSSTVATAWPASCSALAIRSGDTGSVTTLSVPPPRWRGQPRRRLHRAAARSIGRAGAR